jgi:transcription antitermination protein NusB
MALRTKSREFALQMLFQWEMSKQDPKQLEEVFWRSARAQTSTREFANELFEGAIAETERLDELIGKHSEHWRLGRMSAIDRAILRLAAHEMTRTSTPTKVILDEAVKLAKKYSSEEAAPFVNGVLDAVARSIGGPAPAE